MLAIRNANEADIELIRQLTYKVWPQTYTPIVGETQVAYMLNMMYSPEALKGQMINGQSFILCYSEDKPVGFASFSNTEPGIMKLHKLYILPDQQGKGVGRFMVQHISARCIEQHIPILELNVNRYNENAKQFYERTGFKTYKEEDIDIGNGYFMNDYVLRLAIN